MTGRLMILISLLLIGVASVRAEDSCEKLHQYFKINVKNGTSESVQASARDMNTQATVDVLNNLPKLSPGEQKTVEICGTSGKGRISWEVLGLVVPGKDYENCGTGRVDNLTAGSTLTLHFVSGCKEPGPKEHGGGAAAA
jgi:hypothetical protein